MKEIDGFLKSIETRRVALKNSMVASIARLDGLKTASIQIWVRTGSACEAELLASGVSHLAEHMFFKGFSGKSAFKAAEELREIGAEMNAYTSYLKTVFYMDLPSENLEKALVYLSEFISRPNFYQSDFDAEREVILREIDMCKDEPDDLFFDAFSSLAFQNTEFEPSIIGRKKVFEKLSLSNLKNYTAQKYVPSNMFLSVASGEDVELVEQKIKKYFEKIPENFAPQNVDFKRFVPTSRRATFVDFKGSNARILLGASLPQNYFENPALWDFISYALASVRSSVLQKSLKYESEILDEVDCEIFYDSPINWLVIDGLGKTENGKIFESAILSEIDKNKSVGYDKSLHAKFLKFVKSGYADIAKNSAELASKIGELEMIGADFSYLENYFNSAQNLNMDFVLEQFKKLNFQNRIVAVSAPKKAKKTTPKKPQFSQNFLEVEELKNGSKIIFKKIENCKKIHFRLASLMGVWAFKKSQMSIHGLASLMISKGAGNMSANEIADFAESNAISFSSGGGNNSVNIASQSLREDWHKAFELLTSAAICPRFDKKTFEREREILISQIADSLDDPLEKSIYLAKKKFFKSLPLAVSSDGEIDALSHCKNSECAKMAVRFFPANRTVLSVVGDFDKNEILDDAEKFLGALVPQKIEIPSAEKLSQFGKRFEEDGEFNQSLALTAFECPPATDERGDLIAEIMLEILGGSSGLIFELIREKFALAYTTTSSSVAGINTGALFFYALAKKNNLEKILELFSQISEDMRKGKLPASRLIQAKLAIKSRLLFAQRNISSTAMRLALNSLFGYKILDERLKILDSVKLDELVEFSQKYFGKKMEFLLK